MKGKQGKGWMFKAERLMQGLGSPGAEATRGRARDSRRPSPREGDKEREVGSGRPGLLNHRNMRPGEARAAEETQSPLRAPSQV